VFNCNFASFARAPLRLSSLYTENKSEMSRIVCTECGTRVSANAEACQQCGYPVTTPLHGDGEAKAMQQTGLKEYRLIQLLGGAVLCGGILAAMADSPIAAAVSIAIGIAIYLTGLLGAWWNSGD
jgi:ribosomal protein L40E